MSLRLLTQVLHKRIGILLNEKLKNINIKTNCMQYSTVNDRLMEFFDDKSNWNQNEVKVGRAWKTDELRIKSNSDLHKLWYILLKERNMLLSMEHEANEQMKLFPSPERLDKVKESMGNIETVVRERNEAYYFLETGETGERPKVMIQNILGLNQSYKMTQHLIPKELNTKWQKEPRFYKYNKDVEKFLQLYREKLYNEKRKKRNRDFNQVVHLMQRFSNLDLEAVKEQYPDVDLKKAANHPKARGHFVKEN